MLSFRERIVARPGLGPGHAVRVSRLQTLHIPIAYIDPGSGSLIIQAVIAGLIATPIVLRNQFRRAGNGIRRMFGARSESERSKE